MYARSVSRSAGLRLGMLLAAMLLMVGCLPSARAGEVAITVKGRVNGGRDSFRIFGMGGTVPTGTPYTLVFIFDDMKGRVLPPGCPNSGSKLAGSGQASSPGTAVLTINGKSYEFGKKADTRSKIWRSIQSRCSQSEIGMAVEEGPDSQTSGVTLLIRPAMGQPSLTQNADWHSPVSLTKFLARNGDNAFAINRPYVYDAETFSYLSVDSVTVGAVTATTPRVVVPPVVQAKPVVQPLPPPPTLIANPKGPEISKIYVLSTDHGCRVTAYTPDGRKTTPEIFMGGFSCSGIAVDDEGKIYVSWIEGPFRVRCYDQDGKPSSPNIRGLNGAAITLDGKGKLFLLQTIEYASIAVLRNFTMDGTPAGLDVAHPMSLADGIAVDSSGKIYVVSQGNDIVKIYDAKGQETTPIIRGLNTPRGIALSPDGRIYTANAANVMTHLPDGRRVDPTINLKDAQGTLQSPAGVAADSRGRIYVGYSEGEVGIFNPDGKPASPAFRTQKQVEAIAIH